MKIVTMNKADAMRALNRADACDEAMLWVSRYPGATAQGLWNDCPDPRWLIWGASAFNISMELTEKVSTAMFRAALAYSRDNREQFSPDSVGHICRAWDCLESVRETTYGPMRRRSDMYAMCCQLLEMPQRGPSSLAYVMLGAIRATVTLDDLTQE